MPPADPTAACGRLHPVSWGDQARAALLEKWLALAGPDDEE
jgi:hypothetical protein